MEQSWQQLLFAHWPIRVEAVRPLLPDSLQLDLYEGEAWIGIVPFMMRNIRLRHLPVFPFTSDFAELNVRTYVVKDGIPGVYFFSLDASNLLAVKAAKTLYHLPYYHARISSVREGAVIQYKSARYGAENIQFRGSYNPLSDPYTAQAGTLDHWLTERYCLYTNHGKQLFRCDIMHDPWPLQRAEADIETNTMTTKLGLTLPTSNPLLHYAERVDVRTWGLVKV